MKRKTIFILVSTLLVVLLATALFTGCSSNELTSPRDLKVENGVFSWSKVSGAQGYMLYFNDNVNNRFFIKENSLSVDNEYIQTSLISGKTNSLWVRAITLDKYGEPDVLSDRSRLDFNYSRQLETITKIKAKDNSTIEFGSIDGATSYVALVKTDGGEAKEYEISYRVATTGLVGTINGLKNGTYTVSIVAKADGYKDSDPSKEIDFVQTNGGADVDPTTGWTVTFDLNYEGSTPITATAEDNRSVAKPQDPTRTGYQFKGWYYDHYCTVEAGFTSKNSKFNITANTTLYAKWEENPPVVIETTTIYAYFADWTSATALIYEDDTALFEGDGLTMTAVDGKAGWFTAKVDNRTTKIVFTNGTDTTEELAFDKSKPYYANGEFTATEPEIDPVIPDSGYYLYVNGVKHNLALNESADPEEGKLAEYMISLSLNKDDSVEIKDKDNNIFAEYDSACNFTGTASTDGEYTFYLKLLENDKHSIWVQVPNTDDPTGYSVKVIVNGTTTIQLEKNPTPDNANVTSEFFGTFELNAGDSIEVEDSDGFKYKDYEPECGFTGVATITGSYTIYAKKYKDGGNSIWMVVPKNTGGDVGDTITLYYYNINKWTDLKAYAWSGSVNNATWPGVPMTAVEGHENWYQVEISITFGSIIFNGTGGQTADLAVDRSNVYFNGMEWTNDFKLYEGKTTRTVYFYNDQGWANVNCYVWTGSVNNGWPGVAMTAVDGHAGWYQIEISISYVKIIFNDGKEVGASQTDDLDIPTGDEIYYKSGWVESFN